MNTTILNHLIPLATSYDGLISKSNPHQIWWVLDFFSFPVDLLRHGFGIQQLDSAIRRTEAEKDSWQEQRQWSIMILSLAFQYSDLSWHPLPTHSLNWEIGITRSDYTSLNKYTLLYSIHFLTKQHKEIGLSFCLAQFDGLCNPSVNG